MKIAFRISSPHKWTGGVNYLLNLAGAVTRADGTMATQFLLADEYRDEYAARIGAVSALPVQSAAETGLATTAKAMLGGSDRELAGTLADIGADLYFEASGYMGPAPRTHVISWLPDFQHRHLPQLFSRKAWWLRDLRFRRILGSRKHILLSSEDAHADMLRFYGKPRGTVHVVPFAVEPPAGATWAEGEKVRIELGLPERFIFLPNQFWSHKNHRLVVEALALLGDAAPCVAASGNPVDERAPTLYRDLQDRVAQLGLTEKFRMLGAIPFRSVLALNARADALINPSLFEGWSTTVEEAKALGTPLLLSDLGVHREQAGADARFFSAASAAECAAVLAEAAAAPPRAVEADPAQRARAAQACREFGERAAAAFRAAGQT